MIKWRAIYSNTKSGEICEIWEHSKPLSREVFWSLINSMFYDACQGCENAELEALVVGGTRTYVVKMWTFTDGVNIWANVYIDGQLIRRMTIAD